MEILGKFKFPLNNLVKSRRLNVLRDLELKLGAVNAKLGHSEGMILSDPLFPSVSVMLCSPFFQFSKQKVFNLYFLQFWKERKTFSFETKTEGFH